MDELNIYQWWVIGTGLLSYVISIVVGFLGFVQYKHNKAMQKIENNSRKLVNLHYEHSNDITEIQTKIKNLPEYKNMEEVNKRISKLCGEVKKMEGQLNGLEKAFSNITNRVNNLPTDIKKLLDK